MERDWIWIICLMLVGGAFGSALGYAAALCRKTKEKVPKRIPAAGLAGLAGAVCLGLHFGPAPKLGMWAVFAGGLLVLSMTDLDRRVIPNKVLLFLAANRFLWALLLREPVPETAGQMLLGLGIPAVLVLLSALYRGICGRAVLGGGDQKLLLVTGLYLSWAEVLLTLLLGCLLGLLSKVLSSCRGGGRERTVPLGPFLSAGAVYAVCFGSPVIRWYMGFL